MRNLSWLRAAALGLLPAALIAQTTPPLLPESAAPPEVARALRERVMIFYGYHVGGVNRRAIDLVAEDTKDYYFTSQKIQFEDFKIDRLEFDPSFEKAVVMLTVKQPWNVQGRVLTSERQQTTHWKLEDGKWVWYLETQGMWLTPMGPSDLAASRAAEAKAADAKTALMKVNPDGSLDLPPDFADPARVAAQAAAILGQNKLDKDSVEFEWDKPGQDTVTFLSGVNGDVMLELAGVPNAPGLKVTLEKTLLRPRENGVIRIRYDAPKEEGAADRYIPTERYTIRLTVLPFNQQFPIRLTIRGNQN
jgi:hypothetical protein